MKCDAALLIGQKSICSVIKLLAQLLSQQHAYYALKYCLHRQLRFQSRAQVLWDSDRFRHVSVFERLLREIEWESLRSADLHTPLTVSGVMLFSSLSAFTHFCYFLYAGILIYSLLDLFNTRLFLIRVNTSEKATADKWKGMCELLHPFTKIKHLI